MKKRHLITAAALICTASVLAGTVTAAHPLTNATFVWNMGKTEETPAAAEDVRFGWTMLDSGNFQIDFYGTLSEIVWTDAGFDMNYMDAMLMHFIPES